MAKRRSEEARVLTYFRQQPIEKAELMLGLVREEVKQRTQAAGLAHPETVKAKRRARKQKAALAGTQTSFDTEAMAQ